MLHFKCDKLKYDLNDKSCKVKQHAFSLFIISVYTNFKLNIY